MNSNNTELFMAADKIRNDYNDYFKKNGGYIPIINAFQTYIESFDIDLQVDTSNRINSNNAYYQFFIKVISLKRPDGNGNDYDIGVNVELESTDNVNRGGRPIFYFCAIEKGENRNAKCKHGFNKLSEELINNLQSIDINIGANNDHLVRAVDFKITDPFKYIILQDSVKLETSIKEFSDEIIKYIKHSKLKDYEDS